MAADNKYKVCVVGLGYVGLPLAHAFSRVYAVTGYDISEKRVEELASMKDIRGELTECELYEARDNSITFTSSIRDAAGCNVYVITVPTPVDEDKNPDLTMLMQATMSVAGVLTKGDIVIYESTVYPGATEEECVPLLSEVSGLVYNKDFFCGYSPERVNPGDKVHTIDKVIKVVSGSTPEVAAEIDEFYQRIVPAGTYLAPSIMVAEAAKVIENSQRDINIAFVNELAIIFNKMGLDTASVLEAAGTKWNFLPFRPGLVGGHCIGVDPYYLTYKAQKLGYKPEVILAGRRINDNMGIYIAGQIVKTLIKKQIKVQGAKVLILGITFKEDCKDTRNSRVIELIGELKEFGCDVDIADCMAVPEDVMDEYGIELTPEPDMSEYTAVVLAVAHQQYRELIFSDKQIVFDVKSVLADAHWRL